jgi:hypothetical protein
MWCIAELNHEYIAKMEDVLETYERPLDPEEPVVCVDEKPVKLHSDIRPPSPAQPGREARRDRSNCYTALASLSIGDLYILVQLWRFFK